MNLNCNKVSNFQHQQNYYFKAQRRKMFNNFFTPQEIQPKQKSPYKLSLIQSYDFTLLQQDLFQIVSPHVESISDQKRKILSWLKRTPIIERMDILTYTNKEFVCMIRAMYEKKQSGYYDESSTTFTISHIQQTDEFDLLSMINNKKLPKEYLSAEDVIFCLNKDLLSNIRIMSRYTQFDSVTFSQTFIRNVDSIFHYFQILGDGISHQLTNENYHRLKRLPNSVMFYDSSEQHCYKKATIGTWITQVFMKHISMRYLEHYLNQQAEFRNQLKQRSKQFEKYWKIISPQRKNQIIRKVLIMKPIDLYQQHRSMIKVTRNGFPPIQKSEKVPQLLKSIINSNQKEIFDILFYTNLNQTLESHSVLKYYITLELEDQIKKINELQESLAKENKMKKKKKANKDLIKEQNLKNILQQIKQSDVSNIQLQKQYIANQSNHTDNNERFEKIEVEGKRNIKISKKGNDLFYKKLEISQTQQIICIQGNFSERQPTIQLSQTNQIVISKESKTKKKRKNKRKNTKATQQANQPDLQFSVCQQQIQVSYLKRDQPKDKCFIQSFDKGFHTDKNSQKSSQTTNDNIIELKLQSQDEEQKPKTKQSQCDLSQDYLTQVLKNAEKKILFYNKQRKIILNRLSYVFSQNELSFKLYGSSCSGVALPSSDIDIVVDPSIVNYFYFSYSNYRKKIINSLQYLQKVFEKFEWASEFILLPGATIPLLTFTVNPAIEFELQQGNQFNNRKQFKQQVKISVDITIQSYINMTDEVPMHLGLESSELMKEWIQIFPFYSQILILLKLFTKNHNLNRMYHGGISSFMQAIILAYFYKHFFMSLNVQFNDFKNQKEKFEQIMPSQFNISKMFLEFCKFIANFNEQKQIIDINSNQPYCPKSNTIPLQQLIIVNPLTGTVMSERCTTFPLYKKVIQQVSDILNSKKSQQIKQYLNVVFEA